MKTLLLLLVLAQQRVDSRADLVARGVPADLAASAAVIADSAGARGLPVRPILDKAVEGVGKQVAPARIIATLREYITRLDRTRGELSASGAQNVDGETLAAAAQARFRGIRADGVAHIVAASSSRPSVIAGLQVAGALAGQGLDQGTATRLVEESLRRGRTVAQMLDLPAAARSLAANGLAPADIGRQLLQGMVTVPPVVPPRLGLPTP